MCGILGIVARSPVNQPLYDGLLLLQHRGQDAAGIVTSERNSFHMHKAPGMVRDVFRTRKDRKSTRLNSSHSSISYAVFCLKKKNTKSCNTYTVYSYRAKLQP